MKIRLAGINRVCVDGYLGRDPELKYSSNGIAICKISIGNQEIYKDKKTGEQKKRTTWINVNIFGASAEYVGQTLKKGDPVYLEGRLENNEWQDRDGKKHSKLEINALRCAALSSQADRMDRDSENTKSESGDDDNFGDVPF